jgi:tripartite-type tricarboxylate transporter receptor subunit TctC
VLEFSGSSNDAVGGQADPSCESNPSSESKSRASPVRPVEHIMTSLKLPRRQFLHLATGAVALTLGPQRARAQTYPSRPVRFVVPLAAGGGLDLVARLTGEHLARALGQQVVVENRVGAGGMLGIETAAKSPPDGYTVLITTDGIASTPHIVRFNVDYVRTLVPVTLLVRATQVVAVHPSLGVNSVAELIALIKRQPGLSYATSGAGTNQHFLGEWFAQVAGIKVDHVPYRGAGQAINDLIAGHVKLAVLGPAALIPHHRAGTIRIIAQSSQGRSRSLSDVPTIEEAGVKGVVLETWQGAFVPEGTPSEIIARLSAEMRNAMLDAAIGEKLLQSAYDPVGGSADQLAALLRDDSEKYARLAREFKINVN